MELLEELRQAIIDGMPDHAADAARRAVEQGVEPAQALDQACVPGMDYVGQRFGCHEMYLPDVMAASEAMKAAVGVLEPEMRRRGSERKTRGTVVLGTVKGDIHEIGKSLVAIMLSAAGFQVHDLGVSVATEAFAAKIREVDADIVGVSALLTTTMTVQRNVVESLDREGLRPGVKIMVGGAPVTRKWAEEIGADGYAKNASEAVTLARDFMAAKLGACR
jgi:corrinoid protein of di/trimethylamine methyltransferase